MRQMDPPSMTMAVIPWLSREAETALSGSPTMMPL
jgi:hypothetical protein